MWLIIGLIFFLAFPSLLHYLATQSAIDQAVMGPDTEKYWAHFPGESGTIITRNFSFFNMTNE